MPVFPEISNLSKPGKSPQPRAWPWFVHDHGSGLCTIMAVVLCTIVAVVSSQPRVCNGHRMNVLGEFPGSQEIRKQFLSSKESYYCKHLPFQFVGRSFF